MSTRKKLLRELSSRLESLEEDFIDEGSIVNSVVPSPHVSKLSHRPRKDEHKSPEEQRQRLISFIVVYTMIFFNGCCFTAVVPSVPFYLNVLGAPPTFLGWVVSFYSLGQIFGSPTGGFLADKISSRTLLTLSSTLGLVSSAFYSLAPNYWFILAARFITGVSAGMEFSVELTFIARNTTKKQRTVFLASVTAVNVVGFIMGPALGGLLAMIDLTVGKIVIDKYTGPGWLLTLMFMVDICLVQFLFRDNSLPAGQPANQVKNEDTNGETSKLLNEEKKEQDSSYGGTEDDEVAEAANAVIQALRASMRPPSMQMVAVLIFVQFTVMTGWSVLETITSPLAEAHFGWDVEECNLLFTGGGAVSLCAYFFFVVASKWVQDRWLIVGALFVCIFGQMLAIDWQELAWVPHWLSALLPGFRNRFLLGYALMNAGFMTGRPVAFALYSKLVGSENQGKYLGWMVAGGSLARTLGPFFAVAVYYGVKAVGANLLALFASIGIFHVASLVLVSLLWHQLLPMASQMSVRLRKDEESGQQPWKVKPGFRDDPSFNEDDGGEIRYNTKHVTLSLRVTEDEKHDGHH